MNMSDERRLYFEPLGTHRNVIIDWCNCHDKRFPLFIEVTHKNVFEAYSEFVKKLEKSAIDSEKEAGSDLVFLLYGTAKVLDGDPNGLLVVLDHMPNDSERRISLCRLLNAICFCLCHALPSLKEFFGSYHSLADREISDEVRNWLSNNVENLIWHKEEGIYTISK